MRMIDFIFSHMPKTGGSSIRYSLHSNKSLEVNECYASPLKVRGRKLKEIRNKIVCRKIASKGGVMYGHFSLGDLPAASLANAKTIMFFREPIDWLGSYIYYYERKHNTEIVRISEFIRSYRLDQCYSLFLGPLGVADLGFTGIYEQYDSSIAELSHYMNADLQVDLQNVTQRPSLPYRDLLSSRFDFDIITKAMERNFAIYHEALVCFEKKNMYL
jgi:hypothetical protein